MHWRTALVTGASSGIGEAIARRLAAEGTNLVLVARNRERLEELAVDLSGRFGVDTGVLVADLSTLGGMASVEARVGVVEEPIDLVVNNAGFGVSGHLVGVARDQVSAQIAVNVEAVVRVSHAALAAMCARRAGTLVLIGSVAGYVPTPNAATYSATKAFIRSFGAALSHEANACGVSVTTVHPGFTRTDFQARSGYDGERGVPGFAWMTADSVARRALRDAAAGKATSIPGAPYRALARLSAIMPEHLSAALIGAVSDRNIKT